MRAIHVLTAINVLVWGLLVFNARQLLDGLEQQHVTSFPNSAQAMYYLYFPAAVAAFVVLCWLLARSGILRRFVLVAELFAAFSVLPYMFFYTGGV